MNNVRIVSEAARWTMAVVMNCAAVLMMLQLARMQQSTDGEGLHIRRNPRSRHDPTRRGHAEQSGLQCCSHPTCCNQPLGYGGRKADVMPVKTG